MKKRTKIIACALLLVSFATSAHARWLGNAVSGSSETKNPTAQYQLEVTGTNVRVYEWQPQGNKNVRCVIVAGSTNSSGVSCYNIGNN